MNRAVPLSQEHTTLYAHGEGAGGAEGKMDVKLGYWEEIQEGRQNKREYVKGEEARKTGKDEGERMTGKGEGERIIGKEEGERITGKD